MALGCPRQETWECFAWIAVRDATGVWGLSRTATVQLPTPLVQLLHLGKELGAAADETFQRAGSKHEEGTVGILTHGVIDRARYYKHAVIFALTLFANPGRYGSNTRFDPRTCRGAAPSEYGTEDTGICTVAVRHCARWAGRAAPHGQSV